MQCSREELYEQVWSEPMITLAQKYGLSDVGLRKKCKKLNIPLPPQGYFLRGERRKAENRPPLPPFQGDGPVEIKPTKNTFPPVSVDQEQYKEAEARIAFENHPENRLEVPARLTSPHPLIEKTRATKSLTGGPQGGRAYAQSERNERLDVYVSEDNLGRALRIMDTLLKALESRGFKVALSQKSYGNYEPITTVSVLGVVHEFGLKETFNQVKFVPPKESKKKEPSWTYHPKYDFIPSGRFILEIKGYVGDGGRASWSDGKKQKLENCLNDFIIGLIKASVAKRARDLEWERQENERLELARKQAEEVRRREEEKKRLQNLISEAQSWKQGQLIREYVAAVRAKAIEKKIEITPGGEIDRWITWANQQADRLDPLVETPPLTSDGVNDTET
jgi:hypothetical protein